MNAKPHTRAGRSTVNFDRDFLETFAEKFANERPDAAHKPKKVTKQQLVNSVRPKIAALLQEGYSLESIAALFEKFGVAMPVATLRSYLQRSRRATGKRRPKVATRSQSPAREAPPDAPQNAPAIEEKTERIPPMTQPAVPTGGAPQVGRPTLPELRAASASPTRSTFPVPTRRSKNDL